MFVFPSGMGWDMMGWEGSGYDGFNGHFLVFELDGMG